MLFFNTNVLYRLSFCFFLSFILWFLRKSFHRCRLLVSSISRTYDTRSNNIHDYCRRLLSGIIRTYQKVGNIENSGNSFVFSMIRCYDSCSLALLHNSSETRSRRLDRVGRFTQFSGNNDNKTAGIMNL